jgi:hypothetical protein
MFMQQECVAMRAHCCVSVRISHVFAGRLVIPH